MEPLLMKPAEVMQALGIGRSLTYQLIASGELPSVRLGRCVRVPRVSLEQWVRARQAGHVTAAPGTSQTGAGRTRTGQNSRMEAEERFRSWKRPPSPTDRGVANAITRQGNVKSWQPDV